MRERGDIEETMQRIFVRLRLLWKRDMTESFISFQRMMQQDSDQQDIPLQGWRKLKALFEQWKAKMIAEIDMEVMDKRLVKKFYYDMVTIMQRNFFLELRIT